MANSRTKLVKIAFAPLQIGLVNFESYFAGIKYILVKYLEAKNFDLHRWGYEEKVYV